MKPRQNGKMQQEVVTFKWILGSEMVRRLGPSTMYRFGISVETDPPGKTSCTYSRPHEGSCSHKNMYGKI